VIEIKSSRSGKSRRKVQIKYAASVERLCFSSTFRKRALGSFPLFFLSLFSKGGASPPSISLSLPSSPFDLTGDERPLLFASEQRERETRKKKGGSGALFSPSAI